MLDMVGVAPLGGSVTSFVSAVPVSGDEGPSHRWWYHPGGASDVDGLGVGPEDDPVDDSVAGGFPHLVGSQHVPGGGFVDPTAVALEGVEVGEDEDMRLLRSGCLSGVQEGAG